MALADEAFLKGFKALWLFLGDAAPGGGHAAPAAARVGRACFAQALGNVRRLAVQEFQEIFHAAHARGDLVFAIGRAAVAVIADGRDAVAAGFEAGGKLAQPVIFLSPARSAPSAPRAGPGMDEIAHAQPVQTAFKGVGHAAQMPGHAHVAGQIQGRIPAGNALHHPFHGLGLAQIGLGLGKGLSAYEIAGRASGQDGIAQLQGGTRFLRPGGHKGAFVRALFFLAGHQGGKRRDAAARRGGRGAALGRGGSRILLLLGRGPDQPCGL